MLKKFDDLNPEVMECVVCYIDILGFTAMINDAETKNKSNELLNKVIQVLQNEIPVLEPYFEDNETHRIKVFTDNIVISRVIQQDAESELGRSWLSIQTYQLRLALQGLFIRGGICIGDIYMSNDIVYGTGLLEAHDIEEKVAVYPRTILSKKAREYAVKHMNYYVVENSPQNRDLLIDSDGEWFVNYLEAAIGEDEEKTTAILKRHKEVVEVKLNEFSKEYRILQKYLWVANYHNYFITENFQDKHELQIKFDTSFKKPMSVF